jgi:hypothetical protein
MLQINFEDVVAYMNPSPDKVKNPGFNALKDREETL